MGWEGQQAASSPSLNAGRGSSECPWAALGVQALQVMPLPFLASPPIVVTHCAGPSTVPSLALPFLPSLSRSSALLRMALLRGCLLRLASLAPLRSLQPLPPSCAAEESSRKPPWVGEH